MGVPWHRRLHPGMEKQGAPVMRERSTALLRLGFYVVAFAVMVFAFLVLIVITNGAWTLLCIPAGLLALFLMVRIYKVAGEI